MIRRLIVFAFVFAAVSLPAQTTFNSVSVSDDGDMICWSIGSGNTNRIFALPLSACSGIKPQKISSAAPGATGVCSNDSKSVIWKTDKGIYYSSIKTDTIEYSGILTSINSSDLYMGTNADRSRMLINSRKLDKGEKGCSPYYSAIVVAKKDGGNITFSGPLTSTKECSMIVNGGFTRSSFVCYNAYREYGIHLLVEEQNGSYQKRQLPDPENAINGIGYCSPGSDRIFGVFRMNGTDADSTFGIYVYDFVDGKYTAPVLIATERGKWRPQISIAPDGNSIAWTQRPYYEIRSNTENRKLMIARFENGKWSEAEALLDFGEFKLDTEIQFSKIWVTNKNIFLQNYQGNSIWYYSSHDLNGKFTKLNIAELSSPRKRNARDVYEITVTDTISEGEYYPVSFWVNNPGNDTLKFQVFNAQTSPFSMNRNGIVNEENITAAGVWGAGEYNPIYRNRQPYPVLQVIGPNDSLELRIWISPQHSCAEQVFQIQQSSGRFKIAPQLIVNSSFVLLRKKRGFYEPSYYPNGQLLEHFTKGKKGNIVYHSWYKNGKPKSHYTFDTKLKRTGFSAIYDENGNPITVCNQQNRKKYSVKRYYANQHLQEKYKVKSNCMVGKWERRNLNGELISEARFRKFKMVSVQLPFFNIHTSQASAAKYYREYYANGNLKCIVHYSKTGRKRGKHIFYYENGTRGLEEKYFRDKQKKKTVFTPDGKKCPEPASGKPAGDACKFIYPPLPTLVYGLNNFYRSYYGSDF